MVRFQSFILGMAIAGGFLGGVLLLLSIVSGDNSSSDETSSAAPTPTTAALARSTATVVNTPPAVVTVVAVTSPSPTPVATPVAMPGTPTASLSDRLSCIAIRGTEYRSSSERAWYLANCPPEPPLATGGTEIPAATASPPSVVVPTPTVDPFVSAYTALVVAYVNQTEDLLARVRSPRFVDTAWRQATIASAEQVQRLSGSFSVILAPPCLLASHAALRAAGIENSLGAGLTISAIELNDSNLLRLAEQRLSAGRAGVINGASLLGVAAC